MGHLSTIGKLFILFGIFFIVIGIGITFMPKIPFIGRLPGDIHIKRKNFDFYFPITTCFLISIILTILFSLIQRFR